MLFPVPHGDPASGMRHDPRTILLSALAAYRAERPEESSVCDRIAAFVGAHPDAFFRTCPEGHVTGSAFVVDRPFSRVLFVHHAKLGRWLQPGGHCEIGESASQAAQRETLEETGVSGEPCVAFGSERSAGDGVTGERARIFDLDIHPIPARADVPAHLHYDVRYLLVADPGTVRTSVESHAVEWLSLDDAERRNPERSILRPLGKIRFLREQAS